jgi:hypothetical protein
MKNYRITPTLLYQEYDSEDEMFQAFDDYLQSGYKVKETIYLCPVITNRQEEIILSYIHMKDIGEDIKKKIHRMCKSIRIMKPDYSDTILNIIGGIRNNYGYESHFKDSHNVLDRKYKNCIILLLDGLGASVLKENLDEDAFLNKKLSFTEHAIYPSTTAASTTSTQCGLTPLESSWTGWSNWIRELNREIILFTGNNYYTDEPTGRSGFDFIPFKPFFHDMKVKGYIINPDFSKETKDINDVLSDSLSKLNFPQPIVQYVYWPEPDGIMHQYGTYSNEAKEAIRDINDKVERYSQALPLDTILIISADHGHTPVKPINIYNCEVLNRYLKTKPSNDSRCVVFRVKDGMGSKFEKMFNSLFGEVFKLLPSKDAIKMGYFGDPNGHIHQRIEDFLGDYVAIATNQFYLNSKENNFNFKSHHAGITKDEMEVPVIVIRKY